MRFNRVEMNYLKIYCKFIRKAESRPVLNGYVEEHHIFPKSIYGDNKRTVKLTAREHYIAHALLERIFIKRYGMKHIKSIKMIYAFSFMNKHTNQNNYCNSYLYESSRIKYSIISSLFMKEYYKNNIPHFKGKKFDDQHKKNISNALKGRSLSPEHIEIIRQRNIGKIHSKETRDKIKKARAKQIFTDDIFKKRGLKFKNKVWMYDPQTGKNYRINTDNVELKLSSGLVLGRCNFVTEETRMKLSIAAKKQWQRQRNN